MSASIFGLHEYDDRTCGSLGLRKQYFLTFKERQVDYHGYRPEADEEEQYPYASYKSGSYRNACWAVKASKAGDISICDQAPKSSVCYNNLFTILGVKVCDKHYPQFEERCKW